MKLSRMKKEVTMLDGAESVPPEMAEIEQDNPINKKQRDS